MRKQETSNLSSPVHEFRGNVGIHWGAVVCQLLKAKGVIPFGAMMVRAYLFRGKAVVASHPPAPSRVQPFPWLLPVLRGQVALD